MEREQNTEVTQDGAEAVCMAKHLEQKQVVVANFFDGHTLLRIRIPGRDVSEVVREFVEGEYYWLDYICNAHNPNEIVGFQIWLDSPPAVGRHNVAKFLRGAHEDFVRKIREAFPQYKSLRNMTFQVKQ